MGVMRKLFVETKVSKTISEGAGIVRFVERCRKVAKEVSMHRVTVGWLAHTVEPCAAFLHNGKFHKAFRDKNNAFLAQRCSNKYDHYLVLKWCRKKRVQSYTRSC